MFTLLLASFPSELGHFYLCKHSPFMCFSLVLFLLFLGVGFEFNLAPFWGCLSLGLCAFICFIRSLKPSKTVKQPFHLPLDQIVQDSTNELAWFFSLLLPHWCLCFTRRGHLNHREVYVYFKKFMMGDWSSF